jgi:hypothetical protein
VVDALVEERMVLAQLNAKTSVQWIAYGAVWPVGAFDFLVVTVDDTCTNSTGDVGFVIVSTSVDGLVDEEAPPSSRGSQDSDSGSGEEDEDGAPAFRSAKDKYSRSCLRMAGYVGYPNDSGGTELTLYLDLELYAYIPAWLMQILAQNGLSEMMSRFREAAVRMNCGLDPLSVASGAGGSRIGSMLSQIQVRDERLRSLQGAEPAHASLDDQPKRGKSAEKVVGAGAGVGAGVGVGAVAGAGADASLPKADPVEALRLMDFPGQSLQRLLEYTGAAPGLPLDWAVKMNKHNIAVSQTQIDNSIWTALKAELVMNADIDVLRRLLVEDSRMGEYDDMLDKIEV